MPFQKWVMFSSPQKCIFVHTSLTIDFFTLNLCVLHEGKHSSKLLNGAKIHVLLAPKLTSQYRNTSYMWQTLNLKKFYHLEGTI